MINNYNYCTFNKWLQSNWLQPNSAYNPIIFSLTTTTIEKKSRPRLQGAFSFFSTLNSQKRNSVLYSFFSSLKLPDVLAPGWRETRVLFLVVNVRAILWCFNVDVRITVYQPWTGKWETSDSHLRYSETRVTFHRPPSAKYYLSRGGENYFSNYFASDCLSDEAESKGAFPLYREV